MRYVPGQFGRFFRRQDWNILSQEITTAVIGLGLGLYCYEKQVFVGAVQWVNDVIPGTGSFLSQMPGSQALTVESQPFVKAGIIMMAVAGFIKLILYLGIFDLNRMKGQSSKRRGINISGIFQDILTILLGITIGLFTTPIAKNMILVEQVEYPNPWPGILLTAACLLAKFLLYSEVINLNRGGRWIQPHKAKPALARHDWNSWTQEMTSTCIGIGVGFYMYQSGIVTHLGAMGSKILGRAEKTASSFWDKVVSPVTGTKLNDLSMESLWKDDTARIYLMVGIGMICVCVLIKFLLYTSLWDANRTRDALVGHGGRSSRHRGMDTNGIMDEIATLLLTIAIGIFTAPITKNALLENQDPETMGIVIPILIVFLAWFKFALHTGAIQFGPRRS